MARFELEDQASSTRLQERAVGSSNLKCSGMLVRKVVPWSTLMMGGGASGHQGGHRVMGTEGSVPERRATPHASRDVGKWPQQKGSSLISTAFQMWFVPCVHANPSPNKHLKADRPPRAPSVPDVQAEWAVLVFMIFLSLELI